MEDRVTSTSNSSTKSTSNSSSPNTTPKTFYRRDLFTSYFFIRMFLLGFLHLSFSIYLFNWAKTIRRSSYIGSVWPLEYQFFPDEEDIADVFDRYFGIEGRRANIYLVAFGILNLVLYPLFLSDLLNWTLPDFLLIFDLLPFLLSIVDFAENLMIFISFNIPFANFPPFLIPLLR